MNAVVLATWQTLRSGLQLSQRPWHSLLTQRTIFEPTRRAEALSSRLINLLAVSRPLRCRTCSAKNIQVFRTTSTFSTRGLALLRNDVLHSSPSKMHARLRLYSSGSTKETTSSILTQRHPGTKTRPGVTPQDEIAPSSSVLAQAELNAIFGQEIDRDGASELLSRLQRQRREGTLDQDIPYPAQLKDKALEYLRAKYPVDEDAAIIARVDREFDGDWSLPQTNPEKSRSGRSGLQEIRKMHETRRKAEKAERERKERAAEPRHAKNSGSLTTGGGSRSRIFVTRGQLSKKHGVVVSDSYQRRIEQKDAWIKASNKRVAHLREAATAKSIPQMSRWQRLWPSATFTLSVVGLALIFAHVYTPPSQSTRLFPETSPAVAATGTIIVLNVLVFIAWRIPSAWKMMNRAFLVTPANPQAFSMLGAEFSHHQITHMAGNLVGLWLLGTQLHDDIGRGPFLALVACGAVIPSFCSLVPPVMKRIFITATLGGSGIVCALLSASCVLHEGQKIRFSAMPSEYTSWVNTAVILAICIAVELGLFAKSGLIPKALVNTGKSHKDHVGHLAGYATGIAAGCMIRQTDAYWGSVQRTSFWRWKRDQAHDPTAEMLMKPESLEIHVEAKKRSAS